MDFKIVWTETALSDVGAIVGYVAKDNAIAARRLGTDLVALVESLAALPRQGRVYEPSRDEAKFARFSVVVTGSSTG